MNENQVFKFIFNSFVDKDKKYLIRCGKNNDSYLNLVADENLIMFSTPEQSGYYQTQFTIEEIIKIIEDDSYYLDWSRVEFKEVKEDGRNENE